MIRNVALAQNGMLLVFDERGEQIGTHQGPASPARVRRLLADADPACEWEFVHWPRRWRHVLTRDEWLGHWAWLMGLSEVQPQPALLGFPVAISGGMPFRTLYRGGPLPLHRRSV